MAQEIRERYINPYTDFGFKKLFGTEMNKDLQDRIFPDFFEQAETDNYSDAERWQYEESRKVFWDNYSVMKTAVDKAVQKEKLETIHRLQAMGLTVEQIAQGAGISIDEVQKYL